MSLGSCHTFSYDHSGYVAVTFLPKDNPIDHYTA